MAAEIGKKMLFLPISRLVLGGKNYDIRKKIRCISRSFQAEWIDDWAIEFIKVEELGRLPPNTIWIYEQQMKHIITFCREQMLGRISQILSNDIGSFFLYLP